MKIPLFVEVEVDETRVKPSGPVERCDDGSPDIDAMLRHRILSAFSYVEGYGAVTVCPASKVIE